VTEEEKKTRIFYSNVHKKTCNLPVSSGAPRIYSTYVFPRISCSEWPVKGTVHRDLSGSKTVPIDRNLYGDDPLVFLNIHRARKELILENYFNGDSTVKKLAFLSD
jgi:hypothetical protein